MRTDARKDLYLIAFSRHPHGALGLEFSPARVLRDNDTLLYQLIFCKFIERAKICPILPVRSGKRRPDRIFSDRHAEHGRNARDNQSADYAQKGTALGNRQIAFSFFNRHVESSSVD